MMDGRDFGPSRSVHVPPPLLSGVDVESHRLGATTIPDRIPQSPGQLGTSHPVLLHTGKYLSSGINLHSHHNDAFTAGSSSFLYVSSGLAGSSTHHGAHTHMTPDPSFRAPATSSLQMAEPWASHPPEGFAHLPNSLYPNSYIPLRHINHTTGSGSLLAHLSQNTPFDSQKDSFYLPSHTRQPALHSHSVISRTPTTPTSSSFSKEKETPAHLKGEKDSGREEEKDKPLKSDLSQSHSRKERDRVKEVSRSHKVMDLTQHVKVEGEKKLSAIDHPFRSAEQTLPVFHEQSPGHKTLEKKSKNPLKTSSLSNCISGYDKTSLRYKEAEQDRGPKDLARHDENMRPGERTFHDQQKKCDSLVAAIGTLQEPHSGPSHHDGSSLLSAPFGMYAPPHHIPSSLYSGMYSMVMEPARERRVSGPTFVPSVEVYDERNGPTQMASKTQDGKYDKKMEINKDDKKGNQFAGLQFISERNTHEGESWLHGDFRRARMLREEGSVIRPNCLSLKRPQTAETYRSKSGHSPDSVKSGLSSASHKEMVNMRLDAESCGNECRIIQRECVKDSGKINNGTDSARIHQEQQSAKSSVCPEPKWKPLEMGNYATSHTATLVTQHGNGAEEEGKKMYSDPFCFQRLQVSKDTSFSSEARPLGTRRELSAMQSLIKYSGDFTKEYDSRHDSDGRIPFGGLGDLKLEMNRFEEPKILQPLKQRRREPEQSEVAKCFAREGVTSQGDVEIRHPPVGIAVAVARQRQCSKKLTSNGSDQNRPLSLCSKVAEDDHRDERVHRREECVQARHRGHDQEKLLRENKELAEYTHIHPPPGASAGLYANLMLTGGPVMAGSGRWPVEAGVQLATYSWMPRANTPAMWLPRSPYGLEHSLHQGLPSGYSTPLPGSIGPSYHIARDPQSGQLLVVPAEHLAHLTAAANLMERGPPVWPYMYPLTDSSLQHAHQLQLLSHQQLIQQHELSSMQQTSHAMELQRSARLMDRLKESDHRAELDDNATKRTSDDVKQGVPGVNTASQRHRERSTTPTSGHNKALTPMPMGMVHSPAVSLKSESGQEAEERKHRQSSYIHLSARARPSPSPASDPPTLLPTGFPKEEAIQPSEEKDFDVSSGYPCRTRNAPFDSPYPYLQQKATKTDTDRQTLDVMLTAKSLERKASLVEEKPVDSPGVVQPLHSLRSYHDKLKEESLLRRGAEDGNRGSQGPHQLSKSEMRSQDLQLNPEQQHRSSFMVTMDKVEKEVGDFEAVKPEESIVQSCQNLPQVTDSSSKLVLKGVQEGSTCSAAQQGPGEARESDHSAQSSTVPICQSLGPDNAFLLPVKAGLRAAKKDSVLQLSQCENRFSGADPLPRCPPPVPPQGPETGMIALAAASVPPQACSSPSVTDTLHTELPNASNVVPLESSAFEGIALLSEIAEMEQEKRRCMIQYSLESLLLAGRQVLLEGLEFDPVINIRLPRELNPNRKYSWMQKKEDALLSMKSGVEGMGVLEVDYRTKLAELQRRYQAKQRELLKLHRRHESTEKQHDDTNSISVKRGPGRPRKRKHGSGSALPSPADRTEAKCGSFSQSLLLSEDSEPGEADRKRLRGPSLDDDEETDSGVVCLNRRNQDWNSKETTMRYFQQMPSKRRWQKAATHEPLATKLDKALSLTELNERAEASLDHYKTNSGSCSTLFMLPGFEMKDTDSEEDGDSVKGGWPIHSILGRPELRSQCSSPPSSRFRRGESLLKRSAVSGALKSAQLKQTEHRRFPPLLQSFSESSEDSFDQDFSSKKGNEMEEDDGYGFVLDDSVGLCSSSPEDGGLGLLALFAARVVPSPVTSSPLSTVKPKAKQKARNKEDRQSLLGTEAGCTDSESDAVAGRTFSPPRREGGPPGESSPGKPMAASEFPRKPRKMKAAEELGFDPKAEANDEERWTRRRSERIFLHDAAAAPAPLSPSSRSPPAAEPKPGRCSKATPCGSKKAAAVSRERKKGKEAPRCPSSLPMSEPILGSRRALAHSPTSPGQRLKTKPRPGGARKETRGKGGAVSRLMESMAADEDFEPNQDSSFSEDDGPAHCQRPGTPPPRSCVIDKDELKDGLRVLIPMDDKLLYAGHVNTVHSPDIYRVMVEGERGNRPHIYCLEQLLQEAIIDVKPPSVRHLPEGTRIAAYWSQQYRCLYPGTVVRGNSDIDAEDDLITVEFDDGDTGRIPLSHIRLLPPNYKIQCAEPSPALLVPSTKKRGRKSSKDVSENQESTPQTPEERAPKPRGRKPKLKPAPDDIQEDHTERESPTSPQTSTESPLTSSRTGPLLERKLQQVSSTGSSFAGANNTQNKSIKTSAKVTSQVKLPYTCPLYGKVLSVDIYNEPSGSQSSVILNDSSNPGNVKLGKRGKKSGEHQEMGLEAKMQRESSEILIKLDHEGVMSPKTKKTKALMMMEDAALSGRENKAVMGVAYSTGPPGDGIQRTLSTKTSEKESLKADSSGTCNSAVLGSNEDMLTKVKNSQLKGEAMPNSTMSGSEGVEQVREKGSQDHDRSTSSRASSPVSSKSSHSSTSSSSSSSTASSCSSSSSSSSSSTSSTASDDSSCSSDEETAVSPRMSPTTQKSHRKSEDKLPKQFQESTLTPHKGQERKKKQQQRQPQGKSRPKKREGIHLPTTKELAKRQRLPSVENRPKIAAFLPARQLWKWFGKPTQRRGMKGKAKKLFYKAIMRGKEMIQIGDCAVFLSAGRPNLPYIGCIQSMWESWGNNMVVRVKWFYHPEETNPGKKFHDEKNWNQKSAKGLPATLQASNQRKDFMERALYQSSHIDENDVQTVSHKCLVVSLEQYEQMIKTKKYQDREDLYYLAGTYEPTTGMIFNTNGVPIIC